MSDKYGKNFPVARPLEGRRVVVTRPRGQSREITSLLEDLGATVVHCPTIEIRQPDSWEPLDTAIARLESYHWVVFTSVNAVDFFFHRLTEKRRDGPSALERSVVCAIGPVTANAIEGAGRRVDLVAGESKAEGALEAIVERLGGERNVSGVRFLIPRAKVAREILPARLAELGGIVDVIEAYQTVVPETDGGALVRFFNEVAVDAITFTSSSTVSNLVTLTGMKDLSQLLADTVVGCIGPVTAATARRHGLTNILQPESYTAAALVEAIVASLRIQNSEARIQNPED